MPAGTESSDWLVFWIVAVARFLLALTIPRYPIPGILASLLLDAADQTLFQQFTNLDLAGYQGYDKALDIFYLTIAYISTLRNWANHFAFRVSRFLFYWRLVGVALFEITHLRPLLLIFPNTFEYFFIFYEAYRLRWEPREMSRKLVIGAAAAIWIVIKLPQEWWIHIGQLDTTDFVKSSIFDVSTDTAWREIVRTWPGVFLALAVVVVLLVAAVSWFLRRRLRPADRKLAFDADAYQPVFTSEQVREAVASEAGRVVDTALLEKIVLVSLVSLCFSKVLPGVQAGDLQLIVSAALVVLVNTALSHWLARRGFGWAFTLGQFVALFVVNSGLMLAHALLEFGLGKSISVANALFFVLLLTLLVTLFDRYRQVYLMRFAPGG
jgi:hypothetical protein